MVNFRSHSVQFMFFIDGAHRVSLQILSNLRVINKSLHVRIIPLFTIYHYILSMDWKTDKNLDRFERKAIIEAEKRKKPGECLKVI